MGSDLGEESDIKIEGSCPNNDAGGTAGIKSAYLGMSSVSNRASFLSNVSNTDEDRKKSDPNVAIAEWTAAVARYTKYLVFAAAASGVISLLTLLAIKGQLDEMKQSFAADRAYVLNDGFEGYGSLPVAPAIKASFWFNNFGRTPAILRVPPGARCKYSADGFHKLEFSPEIEGRTDKAGLLPEGFIIPVNKRFGPFAASLDATIEDIEKARAGNGKIYCEGFIGYADMRDNLHETAVCFFYDFTINGFFLCPEKGANYHN